MNHHFIAAFSAAAIACVVTPSRAHITLEAPQATIGGGYKAVLRVPHGCDGSATIAIHAQIPEGLIDVKPMPKPGWTLKTISAPYAASYDLYGKPVIAGVKEIIWSGGNLPDEFYDEFVFRAGVAKELNGVAELFIPVVQECEKGVNLWVAIPKAGVDAPKLAEFAPRLALIPAAGASTTFKVGALVITQPWARATPGGAQVAGGYLRIQNTGAQADRLMGGASEIAGAVEPHEMKIEDGVMKMRELTTGLEIPPGASVELKPGSFHLMFTPLRRPLKAGEHFKANLQFEKAGMAAVDFVVEAIGATAPAEDHSMHTH